MTTEELKKIATVEDLEKLKVEIFDEMETLINRKELKEFYTPREFSEITGLKYDVVLKRCREGSLPAHQPYKNGSWLIPGEEVMKMKKMAYEFYKEKGKRSA